MTGPDPVIPMIATAHRPRRSTFLALISLSIGCGRLASCSYMIILEPNGRSRAQGIGLPEVSGVMMPMSTCLAAGFKTTPYWWEAAPPEAAADVRLPASVDIAIVGSGYCGLSAAIELSSAGQNVVVLDAGDLGIGASTRSGGMITGGQKFVVSGAIKSHPVERQQRILEDAKASLDHIEELIARHSLDADYVRCGRLIAAYTPAHFAVFGHGPSMLGTYAPGTVELVPRSQLQQEIGGTRYHGGLLINNYGGLHPAKYHRGPAQSRAQPRRGSHLEYAGRAHGETKRRPPCRDRARDDRSQVGVRRHQRLQRPCGAVPAAPGDWRCELHHRNGAFTRYAHAQAQSARPNVLGYQA